MEEDIKLQNQMHLIKVEMKIVPAIEIDFAITSFANAIARDWPNSKDEAKQWVFDEFHNPDSIIIGAYDARKLVGACSLVPQNHIFDKLDKEEKSIVSAFLIGLNVDLSKAIFLGGFYVDKKYESKMVSAQIYTFAEEFANNRGYKALVAHTARPSEKYNKIKALPVALSMAKMKELPVPRKFFYSNPSDLEKVWLYKLI